MAAPSAVWLGGDPVEWVLCPYDVHHRVPRASLERHAASCRLRRMGYSAKEEAEMYDSSFFYENLKVPTVTMDKDLQFHIVKQARAQSAKEGAGYSEDDSQKGPKSHLEILAEMRDYKRRRQSYRAKNVHITKKSYTEVIRDVIGVHMEELGNQWQENRLHNAEICEGEKLKSSGREDRRSASVDSRQSGGSSRDTECTRHRRDTSRSPSKRRRSRERGKDRDSWRKRERTTGVWDLCLSRHEDSWAEEMLPCPSCLGMKTNITTIKEESRNNNLIILFISCSKHNFHKNYYYCCFAQDSKVAHIILVLLNTCAALETKKC
ncbi:U11/U12 small nuclear ribonucleoprotein 48 kDa protein isoform X2 [Poecile atricapillus]|uniref:U11/U12 small nuclear ribonucleoprotein 48 kDa protein isoform X2 n=1 Tax=Poecile atricapillus TaxID=48891 RepID=UPI00273A0B8B|nr:U11/U12 small nuclear ribonucleoprotein 48 kDa protein isoform X2 [Poecile atricapillus]